MKVPKLSSSSIAVDAFGDQIIDQSKQIFALTNYYEPTKKQNIKILTPIDAIPEVISLEMSREQRGHP